MGSAAAHWVPTTIRVALAAPSLVAGSRLRRCVRPAGPQLVAHGGRLLLRPGADHHVVADRRQPGGQCLPGGARAPEDADVHARQTGTNRRCRRNPAADPGQGRCRRRAVGRRRMASTWVDDRGMEPTFRLLRVRGIPVGAHWTWPVAFAVVAWTLARSVLPSAFPGARRRRPPRSWRWSPPACCSRRVVLHELAHAVVARREGMPVDGITLWLLGGVSDVGGRARSPGQELRVAASARPCPWCWPRCSRRPPPAAGAWAGRRPVHGVLGYVARLNVLVAAFNLIPALPLDGGRILRSWLWRRQRDLLAATRSGARAGQAFGAHAAGRRRPRTCGGGAGLIGVWLVVLGAFLAAGGVVRAGRRPHPPPAGRPHRGRRDGLRPRGRPRRHARRPAGGEPSGARCGRATRCWAGAACWGWWRWRRPAACRRRNAADRRVEDVMTPLDDVPMVDADDPVLDVLDRLNGSNPIGQVVVVDDGCVVASSTRTTWPSPSTAPPRRSTRRATASGGGPARPGGGATGRVAGGRASGRGCWSAPCASSPGRRCTGRRTWSSPPGPVVDVTADVSVAGVPVTPAERPLPGHRASRSAAPAPSGALVAAVRDGRRLVPVERRRAELRRRPAAPGRVPGDPDPGRGRRGPVPGSAGDGGRHRRPGGGGAARVRRPTASCGRAT